MKIILAQASKKFNRDWIFKNLSYTFEQGNSYAITGNNGSGKSTLLQVIAGSTQISNGSIVYKYDDKELPADHWFKYLTIAAPYIELIEEMTVVEFLQFHATFKPLNLTVAEIVERIDLSKAAHKQIRYYSSGMKQRVKLAQAIFTTNPIILLDEPCTNLDKAGYTLYHNLINEFCAEKLLIVCSNDENEMSFCTNRLNIQDWK